MAHTTFEGLLISAKSLGSLGAAALAFDVHDSTEGSSGNR
jgi:hypothetical protein